MVVRTHGLFFYLNARAFTEELNALGSVTLSSVSSPYYFSSARVTGLPKLHLKNTLLQNYVFSGSTLKI